MDGIVLPAGSAWDATVVVSDADGAELGRRRFTFALGSSGLAKGQAQTLIDPGSVIAALLAIAGLVAAGWALAGGSLPLVERTAGRRALGVGAVVALPLALVLLVWRVLP